MKELPSFKSEEEELAFWDTHDPEDYDMGPAEDIILDFGREPKRRLSLFMELSLIRELKQVASAHNLPYQTLARGLIRRSLEQMRKDKAA